MQVWGEHCTQSTRLHCQAIYVMIERTLIEWWADQSNNHYGWKTRCAIAIAGERKSKSKPLNRVTLSIRCGQMKTWHLCIDRFKWKSNAILIHGPDGNIERADERAREALWYGGCLDIDSYHIFVIDDKMCATCGDIWHYSFNLMYEMMIIKLVNMEFCVPLSAPLTPPDTIDFLHVQKSINILW